MERENNMKEFRGTEEEIPKSVIRCTWYVNLNVYAWLSLVYSYLANVLFVILQTS
jgi:hypothetical protein